ncbi:hypothetical protein SAZ10_25670 [Mesorhizobium sp. BAC0120]|uniref:hypothetical protein n=1 Tax=Mesorhizobium sp. BAC0120 TaxID=3090670 RepID=UPI00298C9383|nr:hypothetical protein [Mesorhizobium sp. BAC0120]MDW6025152.1 hypothetical protein [Mesorhizobium sp. BAC0120]
MLVEDPGGELAPPNELLQLGASAGAGSASQQYPAGTRMPSAPALRAQKGSFLRFFR